MALDWPDDMLLNNDPAFIAIGRSLKAIEDARLARLQEVHGIAGHNSLGGGIRPKLGLCNMAADNMRDGSQPEIGDIVMLGYLYMDRETEVLIARLSERHPSGQMPKCPEYGYHYEWTVEPMARHRFGRDDVVGEALPV